VGARRKTTQRARSEVANMIKQIIDALNTIEEKCGRTHRLLRQEPTHHRYRGTVCL